MDNGSDKQMGRKKHDFPSKSVRVYEDVYNDAMLVSAYKKKDMTRFLSEILRPILVKMKREVGQNLVKEDQQEKGRTDKPGRDSTSESV